MWTPTALVLAAVNYCSITIRKKSVMELNFYATRFLSAIVLCLLMLSSSLNAVEFKDPEVYFFNEFFGDFPEELVNAREQKKKAIMLFFEQDECPFCYRMKQTILNRTDVQKYFRDNFLVFKVDIEGDIEIVDFQGEPMTEKEFSFEKYRVRATPVIAFFDLSGKPVVKYIGAPSSVEEFMWLGEFAAEGHYKADNFTRFKRLKKKAAQGK